MLIAQINYVITLYSLYGSEKFMTEVLQYTVKSGIEALALQTLPFQDKKKYLLSIGLANGALIRLELFSNGQLEKKK